jgi:hypothetical protein
MTNIIDKVRKLLKIAERPDGNAEEAAAAAAMAQTLISRHQLDTAMLALDGAAPEADEEIVDFGDGDALSPLDVCGERQIPLWRNRLASRMALVNACRIYFHGGTIHIVGRPSDVETVRYFYAYLAREVERLTARAGAGRGISWRTDYRLGIVDTLRRRLAEAVVKAREDAVREVDRMEAPARATALVRVERGLAVIEKRSAAVAAFYEAKFEGVKARRTKGRINDAGARLAGRKAGESIRLGGSAGSLGSGVRGALGSGR